MRITGIIRLIVLASALPLLFNFALGLGMFLTSGYVACFFSVLFVFTSTGAVFIWVIKNVRASATGTVHIDESVTLQEGRWNSFPILMNSATNSLALIARSHILFTLIAGYVLIAFVFALAYQAIEGTQVNSLGANFYFSLTTLATVGYGDISPRDFGRILACLEMVSGVAYNVLAIGCGTSYLIDLGRHGNNE